MTTNSEQVTTDFLEEIIQTIGGKVTMLRSNQESDSESNEEYDLDSEEGLTQMYTDMVNTGEIDGISIEIAENTRLKDLYLERLFLLQTRNPQLQLVNERAEHLYWTYEMHFKEKIANFDMCIRMASKVYNKWKTEQKDSKISTTT